MPARAPTRLRRFRSPPLPDLDFVDEHPPEERARVSGEHEGGGGVRGRGRGVSEGGYEVGESVRATCWQLIVA